MLLTWMFVVFAHLICHLFANGFSTTPRFEDIYDLPFCEHGCLFTNEREALKAKCRVPDASANRSVTFYVGNLIRITAHPNEKGNVFEARAYTVREADHLAMIKCEVTNLDGTGSSSANATLYLPKKYNGPFIQPKTSENNLFLMCSATNGRPPPELEFTDSGQKIESEQNGDEEIVILSAQYLHGRKVDCCTKSPVFTTECESYTVNYERPATRAPVTTKAATTKHHVVETKIEVTKMMTPSYDMTPEPTEPKVQDPMKTTTNGSPSNIIRVMTFPWLMTSLFMMIVF